MRAQLSAFELALLFYNCLSEYGRDKFKPLVEEFGLLKNMRRGLLFEEAHQGLFVYTAFEGSSIVG